MKSEHIQAEEPDTLVDDMDIGNAAQWSAFVLSLAAFALSIQTAHRSRRQNDGKALGKLMSILSTAKEVLPCDLADDLGSIMDSRRDRVRQLSRDCREACEAISLVSDHSTAYLLELADQLEELVAATAEAFAGSNAEAVCDRLWRIYANVHLLAIAAVVRITLKGELIGPKHFDDDPYVREFASRQDYFMRYLWRLRGGPLSGIFGSVRRGGT